MYVTQPKSRPFTGGTGVSALAPTFGAPDASGSATGLRCGESRDPVALRKIPLPASLDTALIDPRVRAEWAQQARSPTVGRLTTIASQQMPPPEPARSSSGFDVSPDGRTRERFGTQVIAGRAS